MEDGHERTWVSPPTFRRQPKHSGQHMKSILDPSFRYTASFNTNLRKTFARVRRNEQAERGPAANGRARAKVCSFVRKVVVGH